MRDREEQVYRLESARFRVSVLQRVLNLFAGAQLRLSRWGAAPSHQGP